VTARVPIVSWQYPPIIEGGLARHVRKLRTAGGLAPGHDETAPASKHGRVVWFGGRARAMSAMLRTFLGARRSSRRAARELAGDLYGGKVRGDPSLAGVLRAGISASRRGALHQQLAVLGWTSLPYLRSIHQPTLILAGDDDPLVPMLNARILHRLLPRSTLHVFHDGHLGLLTSASDIAPIVEDFREQQ
jgi:pimeloyl-ACP methyl ester carboxylesterase